MKKLISLVFILLIPISTLAFDLNYVYTKYDDEIDSNLRQTIYKKTQEISKAFQKENEVKLKELLSQDFKLRARNSLLSLMRQLKPIFITEELTLLNEYYSTAKSSAQNKVYTIAAANKESLEIRAIRIDEKSFIQILITKHKGLQDLIFLQYIEEKDDWKLNLIGAGIYSFDDMNSIKLINKSKEADKKEEYGTSILYAMAASKLLRPTSYLRYKDEKNLIKYIVDTANDLSSIYPFPRQLKDGNNTSLFQINITNSKNGLIPVFKYTTNTDISNHEKIKEEAKKISKEVFQIYPDVYKNFKYIIFQSYNQLPKDENKQYKIFNTILENGELLISR